MVLTDGRYAVCCLDRNGLRPARYVITKDRHITVASEIGVYDYEPSDVVEKGRLGPGGMLAVDLQHGEILHTDEIEKELASRAPYKKWLKQGVRYLDSELVDRHTAAEPMAQHFLRISLSIFKVTEINSAITKLILAIGITTLA